MRLFGWKCFHSTTPIPAGQASIEDNTFGFIWHRAFQDALEPLAEFVFLLAFCLQDFQIAWI